MDRPESATGGYFSSSYIVRSRKGKQAFLKAMDYRKALESPDPALELQVMTAAYLYERNLLEKCKTERLTRIVRIIGDGTLPAQKNDPSSVVQYLIFELADGDIRSFVTFNKVFDAAWTLRTMHQATAALMQLHSVPIAHQDLKPSNVLVFDKSHSKLGDLGRASEHNNTSPYDELTYAGDRTYAPPELLYGHVDPDWRMRRLGCDMYLLGSLVVFLSTEVSMTHLLFNRLDRQHLPPIWTGSFEEVLPYIQSAFAQIIREIRKVIQPGFSEDIPDLVNQLCNPDPERRGLPMNKGDSNRYSLERFVSKFDLLARKAEYSLIRGTPMRRG